MSTTICTISAPLDPALHPPWSPARKRLRAWHNRSKPLSIQWLVEAPHTERLSPLKCILWPDIQEILDDFGHSVGRKSRKNGIATFIKPTLGVFAIEYYIDPSSYQDISSIPIWLPVGHPAPSGPREAPTDVVKRMGPAIIPYKNGSSRHV